MFWLGSGPIRGFAVTLTIGIFTSVFTALLVTRLLVAMWLRAAKQRRRSVEVPI
jgi:preprotein translocase subunit SecD